jgi:hypothetical protein
MIMFVWPTMVMIMIIVIILHFSFPRSTTVRVLPSVMHISPPLCLFFPRKITTTRVHLPLARIPPLLLTSLRFFPRRRILFPRRMTITTHIWLPHIIIAHIAYYRIYWIEPIKVRGGCGTRFGVFLQEGRHALMRGTRIFGWDRLIFAADDVAC